MGPEQAGPLPEGYIHTYMWTVNFIYHTSKENRTSWTI